MHRRWVALLLLFAAFCAPVYASTAARAATPAAVHPVSAAACWQRGYPDTHSDGDPDVVSYFLAFDCATSRFSLQFSIDPHGDTFGIEETTDLVRLWISTGSGGGCFGYDRLVAGLFDLQASATVFATPTCSPATWTIVGPAVFQPVAQTTFRMSFPAADVGGATFHWFAETPQPTANVRDRFPDAGAQAATGVPYHPTATSGYWLTDSAGGVHPYGNAKFFGDLTGIELPAPIVGMSSLPTRDGYWLLGRDGGVFAFGAAAFYGSTGALHLNELVEGMAATPSGRGYWFVASDGGIFSYGDASFYGSTGALRLNRPIVGMAATPSGRGYWLVAGDGGIFSFGDAAFYGSTGALHLDKRIEAMTASSTGHGYRFVASDGGVFSFGDAPFYGSLVGTPAPLVVALD